RLVCELRRVLACSEACEDRCIDRSCLCCVAAGAAWLQPSFVVGVVDAQGEEEGAGWGVVGLGGCLTAVDAVGVAGEVAGAVVAPGGGGVGGHAGVAGLASLLRLVSASRPAVFRARSAGGEGG